MRAPARRVAEALRILGLSKGATTAEIDRVIERYFAEHNAVPLFKGVKGKVPFPAENVYAEMRSKMQDDPIPPRRLRNDISPQLEEIVLHALERDPQDRFENALEFREALSHPESVVMTGRASRQRPRPKLRPWLRTLLTIIGGVGAYILLMWVFSQVSSKMRLNRVDPPHSVVNPR